MRRRRSSRATRSRAGSRIDFVQHAMSAMMRYGDVQGGRDRLSVARARRSTPDQGPRERHHPTRQNARCGRCLPRSARAVRERLIVFNAWFTTAGFEPARTRSARRSARFAAGGWGRTCGRRCGGSRGTSSPPCRRPSRTLRFVAQVASTFASRVREEAGLRPAPRTSI